MDKIEEFLQKQERYYCERLRANITEDHCKLNIKAGMIFACTDCPGLSKEIESMGKLPECKEPGCSTMSWKQGFCWEHHPEKIAAKRQKPAKIIPEIIPEAAERNAVKFAVFDCSPPAPAVIHEIDLVSVFRQKQKAEMEAFVERLSAITDPVEKLRLTLEAVQI